MRLLRTHATDSYRYFVHLFLDAQFWWSDTGTVPTYTNWDISEPDLTYTEFCVNIDDADGMWIDEGCSDLYGYVCKMPASKYTTLHIIVAYFWHIHL